jgi:hypothetical protein
MKHAFLASYVRNLEKRAGSGSFLGIPRIFFQIMTGSDCQSALQEGKIEGSGSKIEDGASGGLFSREAEASADVVVSLRETNLRRGRPKSQSNSERQSKIARR